MQKRRAQSYFIWFLLKFTYFVKWNQDVRAMSWTQEILVAGAGAAEHRVPVGLGQVGESRIPAGRALVWRLPVCAEGLA